MNFSLRPLKLLLVVLVIPMFSFTGLHKFYVSVTQIEYVEDKQSVQIITRIFIDDMERLLRERYDESITLAIDDEKTTANFHVEKYLKEKLKILINGKSQQLSYLGKEYEDDIMYAYLEIEGVERIDTIEISNQVLFELFEEQQNIVRAKINGKHKSFILVRENDKGVLNFN